MFFTRSDIDIDQLQISQQDLRLLEILTIRYLSLSHLNQVLDDPMMSVLYDLRQSILYFFRNNAEQERKQHQHKLRIQWEEERCQREAAKTELEKEYRKQVRDRLSMSDFPKISRVSVGT